MIRCMRHATTTIQIKCYICGIDNVKIYNGNPDWRRYYGDDHDKEWDRISFVCPKCNSKIRERLSHSRNNIVKSLRDCRTGNQDPASNTERYSVNRAIMDFSPY